MSKLSRLWPLLALLACLLALAGCGGTRQSATGSVHPAGWGSTPKGLVAPRLLTSVPTATMFDAVSLSAVPAHPFAVAGYIAGSWPTWFSLAKDFPAAHRVSIAIHLGEHAMCGDFEPGDMAASQAGEWAKQDAGFSKPCEYSDLSEMPAVEASDRAVLGPDWRAHVLLWLAWYRGFPGLVAGYDAVQYTDACLGRNLDCSTVSLAFLSIAQPPYVPPPPPVPVLPVCFSHRIPAQTCANVKARVASDLRAAASSQRAYTARGCPGIAQRRNWFYQHISKPPVGRRAYRTAAYQASVRAFERQTCPVFGGWQGTAGRIGYFTTAAAALKAAN